MNQFALVVINGPQPGTTVELRPEDSPLTIGRDAIRELPLDDQLASRLHARLLPHPGGWQIEDCGSRNGTFVNGQPVERAMLESGDLIRIGGRLIVFTRLVEGGSPFVLRPSQIAATTFALRVREPHRRRGAEPLVALDAQAPATVALLCRLATGLHQAQNRRSLIKQVSDALQQALRPARVRLWLAGTDGRLRIASGDDGGNDTQEHLLASLAWENNEALVIGADATARQADAPADQEDAPPDGTALAVPIPGRGSRRGAIECFRDRQEPPFTAHDLDLAIAVAHLSGMALENLEHRERLELSNAQLRDRIAQQSRLLGESPPVVELKRKIARVAETNTTLLILGETGTGKELVAATIHDLSPRSAGPYVAVNCAAFSETLLESELFGHEAGAFTGADRRRVGQFERAHSGTIFLDEVGEMSAACQAKLLRVLEGHPFQRVGGEQEIRVDVRIIAATHRDLSQMVQSGRFREDLYYRLRVVELHVPPLRERGDDVLLLASAFLEHFHRQMGRGPRRFSQAAADRVANYPWPGNVRELRNAIERAVVLGDGDEVQPDDLGLPAPDAGQPTGRLVPLAEAELQHIRFVLDQVGGNKTQACKILGIGRATLYKRLEQASV